MESSGSFGGSRAARRAERTRPHVGRRHFHACAQRPCECSAGACLESHNWRTQRINGSLQLLEQILVKPTARGYLVRRGRAEDLMALRGIEDVERRTCKPTKLGVN